MCERQILFLAALFALIFFSPGKSFTHPGNQLHTHPILPRHPIHLHLSVKRAIESQSWSFSTAKLLGCMLYVVCCMLDADTNLYIFYQLNLPAKCSKDEMFIGQQFPFCKFSINSFDTTQFILSA